MSHTGPCAIAGMGNNYGQEEVRERVRVNYGHVFAMFVLVLPSEFGTRCCVQYVLLV